LFAKRCGEPATHTGRIVWQHIGGDMKNITFVFLCIIIIGTFANPGNADASVGSIFLKTAKYVFENTDKEIKFIKRIWPNVRLSKIETVLFKQGRKIYVNGKKVYQRNDLFRIHEVDAFGRSNLKRMKKGLAPIGLDGKPIELHHLRQKNNGPILELTSNLHNKHSAKLHRYTNKSEIDRNAFMQWKNQYWKKRAEDF